MNLRDLRLRLRAMVVPGRVERELQEELAFHIDRETEKHVANGLGVADARERARARFGPAPLAADQCRDARGVSFVDDVVRDVRYAFRTFREAPLAALPIVATVALGLGLVAAVFAVYDAFLLRVDAVQRPGELFAIGMDHRSGPDGDPFVVFSPDEPGEMLRETSVFADAFAMRSHATRVEGHLTRSAFVTGNFFQVLGVQARLGRPLLPDDDGRGFARPVIVLSDAGWRKLFQGDRVVVGRRVPIDGAPHEIVGVMPDDFRGLSITAPDYWAPLGLSERFRDTPTGATDTNRVEVVGRLKPAVSREAATSALAVWASVRAGSKGFPARPIHVLLAPRQGTLDANDTETQLLFAPLFFAFGLVLVIGCANVANLLLARGVSRQREIGIRLSLGASRRRIIRQLLTESLLLALAAAACALLVSRLVLEGALSAALATVPPEFVQPVSTLNLVVPASDWRVGTFLVVGAAVSTVFFGLAPALQATRLDLVRTIRGEVAQDARPSRVRHALIAVQVGASALLLICAAIFLRAAFATATRDLAIRTSDTLRVSIEVEARREAILRELRSDPSVAIVAAASLETRGIVEATGSPTRLAVDQLAVSDDYFTVLGLDLVAGRGFTSAERTAEAGVVMVSQSLARQLWPDGSGLGQVVRLEAPARRLTVIGIVRDAGRGSENSPTERLRSVYLPTGPERPGTRLMLRVRGNPDQVRLALLERLTGLDPAFGIMTLRAASGMRTYLLRIAFGLTIMLGGLALLLTVSGLFGVLSYLVEQQTRDIGVRMALGAGSTDVVRLVLSQSFRPVGLGLAAGTVLAAAAAIVLRATPAASEINEWVDAFDPMAYAASAFVIAAACLIAVIAPTLRAARIDPMATLRRN
jgi:predicted permease